MGSLLTPNDNIQDIQRELEMGGPGGKEEKKAGSQKKCTLSIDTYHHVPGNLSSVEYWVF